MASVSRYEQNGDFKLLPDPFTIEGGELTTTQTPRRQDIAKKYATRIEAMYARNTVSGGVT